MTPTYRRQRRLALTLMLFAVVPLALGGWRLCIWKWGQSSDFFRYDPPRANWEQLRDHYQAMADKGRRDNPHENPDNEEASKYSELARLLGQDYEDGLARARRLELRFALIGLAGAFVMFNIGYWRRDRQPTVG